MDKGIHGNAVNVKDVSDIAKAIVEKGLTFKGTKLTKGKDQIQKPEQATLQLGNTIAIDSSESKHGESKDPDGKVLPHKENDIDISVVKEDKDNVKIKLELNKSTKVSEDDERVVTSKAVKTAIDTMQNEINDKISKTDANNPFETTYKDKDGKELVKVGDKYYKKEDVKNLKYDETKKKFVNSDNSDLATDQQPKEVAKNGVKAKINLKGDTPKKIANVDSGLGLEKYQDPNTDDMDEEAKKERDSKS